MGAAHIKKMAKRASAKISKKAVKAALTKKKTPSSLKAALTKKPSSKKTIAKKGKVVSFIVRKEDEIIDKVKSGVRALVRNIRDSSHEDADKNARKQVAKVVRALKIKEGKAKKALAKKAAK